MAHQLDGDAQFYRTVLRDLIRTIRAAGQVADNKILTREAMQNDPKTGEKCRKET